MQVQNPQSGQVAVTWTGATRFTQTVAEPLSAVKAGDCVSARAASGTSASATTLTATTVTVSQPVGGSCTGGLGGGFGRGTGGGRPSGVPSGTRGSGYASGRAGSVGATAFGTVVSVSGSSLVVDARRFGGASSSASPTTAPRTVQVDAATKITTAAPTTAGSLRVGRCATALGSTDSSGSVSATSVSITDPVDGQCTGYGGYGGRGTGGYAGGTGGSGA